MRITRIYSGADGESHFEDVEIELSGTGLGGQLSEPVSASSVIFRAVDGGSSPRWRPGLPHGAATPVRREPDRLRGDRDGPRREATPGPGAVLLAEDTTGRGHISRALDGEPRTCLFIPLA